jgi:4-amino-4-deoxy-L-arabinose transferase-like glycosyltransferase
LAHQDILNRLKHATSPARTVPFLGQALLLAVVVVATFLRFYRLDSVPTGLLYDEAYNGLDVVRILDGARPIFLSGNFGREALFIYLQAISVALLGHTDLALRLVSAIIGSLTVIVSYPLVRRLFDHRVAILTTAMIAISTWHIIFSRIGLRSILLPFFVIVTFLFMWRGIQASGTPETPTIKARESFVWNSLAGLSLGLTAYTYSSARFVPIVIMAFVSYLAIWHFELFRRSLRGFVNMAVVASIVVAPLGVYFAHNPADFTARSNAISVFNPELNNGSTLQTLATTTKKTLGMFSVEGDRNWDRNISGRPVFDPILSVAMLLGAFVLIRRFRQPAYAFVLIWLIVMLLPNIVTVKDVPNFLRVTGIMPAVFIIPALGIVTIWRWWEDRTSPRLRPMAQILTVLLLIIGTADSYRSYFHIWAQAPQQDVEFNGLRWTVVSIARDTVQDPGERVYLGVEVDHPVFGFAFRGQPGSDRILMMGGNSIVLPQDSSSATYLYTTPHLPPSTLRVRFFGDTAGDVLLSSPLGDQVSRFRLSPDQSGFEPEHPLGISFDGRFRIVGIDYPRSVRSGESLTISWHWQTLSGSGETFLFNQLFDETGTRIGQSDGLIFRPSFWHPGTRGVTPFDVHIDPNATTGAHWLHIGAYDRGDESRRLAATNDQGGPMDNTIVLGPIKVYGHPRARREFHVSRPILFEDDVTLTSFDLSTTTVSSGSNLPLTLFWTARGQPSADYTVFVHVVSDQGDLVAQADGPPRQGLYPTSTWDAEEIIEDPRQIHLPSDLPAGNYTVFTGMYKSTTGERLAVRDNLTEVAVDSAKLGTIVVTP